MPIRERGDKLLVDIRRKFGGETITFRKTVGTLEEAKALHDKVLADIQNGVPINPEKYNTFCDDSEKRLSDLIQISLKMIWSENTDWNQHVKTNLYRILDIVGDIPLSQIKRETLDNLIIGLKDRGITNSTINRYLSSVSKMLNYAYELEWIDKVLKIHRVKENPARDIFLSIDEEKGIYGLLDSQGKERFKKTIQFLIDTGMRIGEMRRVKKEDLKEGCYLTIWETKAGNPRTISLTDRALEIFNERDGNLLPESDQVRYSAWNMLKKAMINSGERSLVTLGNDKDFVFHALRHTCASRLVQNGVDLYTVGKWLGHRNVQTTTRYAHLRPEDLTRVTNVLNNLNTV